MAEYLKYDPETMPPITPTVRGKWGPQWPPRARGVDKYGRPEIRVHPDVLREAAAEPRDFGYSEEEIAEQMSEE